MDSEENVGRRAELSRLLRRAIVSTMAALLLAGNAAAATITVVNLDGAGEGFNDPTPLSPAGGNSGTTIGAQRLIAFQFAADLWAIALTSNVGIRVGANFDPLTCSSTSAVLGSAGPTTVHRDFPGAPLASTWYPQALANKLAGTDLDPSTDDIGATFNSAIGTTCSFPKTWYYGLDGNPGPSQTDFVTVVLHEIGHGLGFLSLVSLSSGTKFLGFDDPYMRRLEDHSTGLLYPNMTDAERVTASTDTGDLHWIGPAVVAGAAVLTSGVGGGGHVEMYAPSPGEPGSSVSHFSTSLFPDEVMEPFFTGPNHDPGLALELMMDIGWGPLTCGNGTLDPGEQCDDGNTSSGDCCSSACTFETSGSLCDDGDACTLDEVCDGAGSCTGGAPRSCDDGNPCTDDSCAPATGCVSSPNSSACDDGIACTAGDLCVAGSCRGVWDPIGCALDPFKLYRAKKKRGTPKLSAPDLILADQFETKSTAILRPALLGNPVDKDGEGINVPLVHLQCYRIKDAKGQAKFARRLVDSTNQFGTHRLLLVKPRSLCVPTSTSEVGPPDALPVHQVDRFKCYRARRARGSAKFTALTLSLVDAFEAKQTMVLKPAALCNPVDENGGGIFNLDDHLACYKIRDAAGQARFSRRDVFASNEFDPGQVTAAKAAMLCVPSSQTDLGAP